MSNEITDNEAVELATLERVIETGMKCFTEVGNALLTIRDSRLYRSEYTTFEAYCRERWGMSRPRAYQYIDAAATVSTMVDKGIDPPQSERQARPLAQLPPERQAEAWQAATETAKEERRKVTAKDVETQVEKRKEEKGEDKKPAPRASVAIAKAQEAIELLRGIPADDQRRTLRRRQGVLSNQRKIKEDEMGKEHFDAATHRYTIDGRPVPSVTTVLADILPVWQASEWHLQRGTAVHACAALIARGQAFEYDPVIDGQVAACRKWFRDFQAAGMIAEMQLYSRRYQYAGTLDLVGPIAGLITVLDWKATLTATVRYQLAAYALAYEEMTGIKASHGVGVELRDTGEYKMGKMISGSDFDRAKNEWLCILTAYKLRQKHQPKGQDNE